MREKNKRIPFTAYSSIFTGKAKRIYFDMLDDFDFSSVKNIITMKFINPPLRALMQMFGKIKTNSIKFKEHALPSFVRIFASSKDNLIKIKNDAIGVLKLDAKVESNKISFKNTANATIKLPTQSQIKIKFSTIANENLDSYMKSNTSIKFNVSVTSKYDMFAKVSDNKIKFSDKYKPTGNVNLRGIVKENKVNLSAKAKSTVALYLKAYDNSISMKAYATAYMYRPILLGSLYDDLIGDWYDKTIEEIFYGYEII